MTSYPPFAWQAALIAVVCVPSWASAQPQTASATGPVIPAYERFHRISPSAPGGELLLSELNCAACHAGMETPSGGIEPKAAPDLSAVGGRVRPDYLREYLRQPHQQKPGATMPDVLRHLPPEQKQEEIENLVHYLASTGELTESRQRAQEVSEGRKLYHEVGCVACHGPREGSPAIGADLKPLGKLEPKYSIASLAAFLQDPLKVRHSGRMPNLRLAGDEAQKISQYLLQDLDVEIPANLAYAYYEGNFNALPDFTKLKPRETGEAMDFDLALAKRRTNFGLVFEGYLQITENGRYTFHLDSDDGSRMTLDGQEVVRNDGIHPKQRRSGQRNLKPGMYKLRVEYFDGGGQIALDVSYDGPGGIKNAPLIDRVYLSRDAKRSDPDRFQVDSNRAAEGRKSFVNLGCANCHQMEGVEGDSAARRGPTLAEWSLSAGCLAEQPHGAPDFQLTPGQRQSLSAAVEQRRGGPATVVKPEQQVLRTLETFNCYACHQRGEQGGVQPELNSYFLTTQAEMGDEGRIPPSLDGVGAKLTAAWMKKVLSEGAKDRPYMRTVMPNFGHANVGQLEPLLAELDDLPKHPPIEIPETEGRIKALGRHMVGDKVFGCIKCHTFNGEKASGVQGIDMTLMPQRVRHDWFLAYVIDPPRFRPGTRMPTAWPNGKSVMRNILDGDAEQQVEAIWRYLEDGKNAAKPYGVGQQPIELIAWRKAVIYRNFIEGAGTRAIGVGFPEKANIAFDANTMHLALIWQGAFIDASRHWTGRGQGFQGPLGDNVVRLPGGPPLAVLDKPDAAWPEAVGKEAGYQFLGYRLDELNRPTFRYRFGDSEIEDRMVAEKEGDFPMLVREITVLGASPPGPLMLRVLHQGNLKELGDGWFQVSDGLKVHIRGATPILRPDQNDLLVRLSDPDEQKSVTLKYVW